MAERTTHDLSPLPEFLEAKQRPSFRAFVVVSRTYAAAWRYGLIGITRRGCIVQPRRRSHMTAGNAMQEIKIVNAPAWTLAISTRCVLHDCIPN
jgi:hypothetical protein